MSAIFVILVSYFIGAIPTGYLVARHLKGIDIREHGSGNPGATNVGRVVGKEAGTATLIIDILKGLVPVLIVRFGFPREAGTAALCGMAAIAGHIWSPFLNFKGGKGVATSAGVFLALLPIPTVAAVAAFAFTLKKTKHVSAGSLAAAFTLPAVALIVHTLPLYRAVAIIAGIAVIVKHKTNIQRLREGTEPRYDEKKG